MQDQPELNSLDEILTYLDGTRDLLPASGVMPDILKGLLIKRFQIISDALGILIDKEL